jgi:hypothetical protein
MLEMGSKERLQQPPQRHLRPGSSDFPEVAEFLVRLGIDSLLNPDSLLSTTLRIINLEASNASGGTMADRTRSN